MLLAKASSTSFHEGKASDHYFDIMLKIALNNSTPAKFDEDDLGVHSHVIFNVVIIGFANDGMKKRLYEQRHSLIALNL